MSGWQGVKVRFEKKDKAMLDEYNDEINALLIFVSIATHERRWRTVGVSQELRK